MTMRVHQCLGTVLGATLLVFAERFCCLLLRYSNRYRACSFANCANNANSILQGAWVRSLRSSRNRCRRDLTPDWRIRSML